MISRINQRFLNVTDARAMARWYVEHAGFQIVRSLDHAPFTHFLADETDRVVMEIYSNPAAAMPDYTGAHPLVFHLALYSTDARADQARLEQAGASLFKEENLPDGTRVTMMRDPWGLPLQLCQRAEPFAGF